MSTVFLQQHIVSSIHSLLVTQAICHNCDTGTGIFGYLDVYIFVLIFLYSRQTGADDLSDLPVHLEHSKQLVCYLHLLTGGQ